ncbi:MAG: hypothetical protein CMJ31_14320 [Phycisphaerae bacterium]|nr:hypothetical protein [Phycisphaerae bacterium]
MTGPDTDTGPTAGAEAARGIDLPSEAIRTLVRWAGMFFFAGMVSLGAHVAIPIEPFGVPFTLQTLAVVLAALCLGPRYGLGSMALYIAMGIVGVPLFAEGEAGLGVILGQSGGYVLGFAACQPVITSIVKRRDGSIRGWGAMIAAVVVGHLVIFAIGVPWLYFVRLSDDAARVTFEEAVRGGLVPFLPGMVVKAVIAVWIGRVAAPLASRQIW